MEIFAVMLAVLVPAAWVYGVIQRARKRRKDRKAILARRLSEVRRCG